MTIEIRSAAPADIDRICEIVAEALEPEDADEARIVLEDPAFDRDRWLVAELDGRVASTLALFDADLRVGVATMPAGQIEFVASDETVRGRGLVRAQMEEAHRRSAAAGHVAQFIVGIPNFYRQFGYSYAVRQPAYQMISDDVPLETGAGWQFRMAMEGDLPAIVDAQVGAQSAAEVALAHPADLWRWLIASPNYEVLIAEHKGRFAVGRVYEDGDTAFVGDVVTPAKGALHGLVAAARERAADVAVLHRPDDMTTALLRAIGETDDEHGWYYVRVSDPAAMLDALRPELEQRLAASELAGFSGTLTLSSYRSSVAADITGGAVGRFVEGGPVPYPVSVGASGVPEDRLADLFLGPHGALELEHLHGDVLLGEQRELMATLFPPLIPDLQTWVFP